VVIEALIVYPGSIHPLGVNSSVRFWASCLNASMRRS
jgi:hypothetical protein